ncbi:DNA-binding HxlR family transcriptional regulator [Spirosoma lacussanchae]|uniref:winged helix-turn-helix transcriptional regulator n=1 Tax=Spirosoma lacussanchae TaxID=1884249 RepID=UPI001108E1B1|nr:helix-turn-helix domain-containing protein [Spirosoma lacussanchae]
MVAEHGQTISQAECKHKLGGVHDALYVLSGKWKLPIVIALHAGPKRFGELQRVIGDITPKLLSKELKELEMNEFVKRQVYASTPVLIEYELTQYGRSLDGIIQELCIWGIQHRARIQSR